MFKIRNGTCYVLMEFQHLQKHHHHCHLNLNRLSGRAIYAKVNQSNLTINAAFPKDDTVKGLDLTWTHYLKPTIPLKINGWVSDSDLNGNDGGVSVGVEIPLERNMFHF